MKKVIASLIEKVKADASFAVCLVWSVLMIASFVNDARFFDFSYKDSGSFYLASGNPHAVAFYSSVKVVFMVASYLFVLSLSRMVRPAFSMAAAERNGGDRKLFFTIFALFFIYLAFIILTWPGRWWCNDKDEFKIFQFAKHLQIQYHQGTLMPIFYILALMVWPAPGMVVIVQALAGSIVAGWIVHELHSKHHKTKSAIFFFLVNISPCMIYFMLYPMRAYLTAVFLAAFVYQYYDLCASPVVERKKLVRLMLFACLVVNFRIEMLALLVFSPLMFFFVFKGREKHVWRKTACLCAVILCSVLVVKAWDRLGNRHDSVSHNMLSFVAPVADILARYPDDIASEELRAVDAFFDVEKMRAEHAATPGNYANLGYSRMNKPGLVFSMEEYRKCRKTMFLILARHPWIFVRNKLKLSYHTVGLSADVYRYYRLPKDVRPKDIAQYFKPLNRYLGDTVRRLLAGDFTVYKSIPVQNFFFPMWLPALLSSVMFLVSFVKKSYHLALIHGFILCMFIAVLLTMVTAYSMYYLPMYYTSLLFTLISIPHGKDNGE